MPDPGRALRAAGGGLASAFILAATALLSHWPAGRPAQSSELRLAMRSAIARLEHCRERTADELAALPAHLRAPRVCSETAIDYRIVVLIDGEIRLDRVVRHGGVRRTRPLTIDRALAVEPGRHSVDIRFEPDSRPLGDAAMERESGESEDEPGSAGRDERDDEVARLPHLRLTTVMTFQTGRARLVRIGEGGDLEIAPEAAAAEAPG